MEFSRALASGKTTKSQLRGLTPETQQLLAEYHSERAALKIDKPMESVFNESVRKQLVQWQERFGPSFLSRSTKPYLLPIRQVMQGQPANAKAVQSSIVKLIEDQSIPREIRDLAIGLHDMPTEFPEIAFKASRKAASFAMTEMVKSMPNAVLPSIPQGMEKQYMKTMWPSFIKKGQPLFVNRDVELALRDYSEVPKISATLFNKYFLSPWKTAKIMPRLATHIRNIVGNLGLNWMGGLSPFNVGVYLDAIQGMRTGAPTFKRLSRELGYEGTFIASDVFRIGEGLRYRHNMMDAALSYYDRLMAPAAKLYGNEEMVFKYAKYLHGLDKGMAHKEAAWDAMKWTFNYGEVTRATAMMRSTLMPFFTWQSKMIPLLIESATTYPLHYASMIGAYKGLQQMTINSAKASDDEWATLERTMPDYVKKGMFLVLPFRDAKDRLQYLNLTFMIPGFGDLNELKENPVTSFIANPIIQIASAMATNRRFNGSPICYDWEPAHVRVAKKASYLWDALLPASIGPIPVGTDWNALRKTWEDSPEGQTWGQFSSSMLGFKVNPMPQGVWGKRHRSLVNMHMSEARGSMKKELQKAQSDEERSEIQEKYQPIFRHIPQPAPAGD
jgi:hypothetical protein